MLRGRRLIILTRGGQRLGKNCCDDNVSGGGFWPYVTPGRAQDIPKKWPKGCAKMCILVYYWEPVKNVLADFAR